MLIVFLAIFAILIAVVAIYAVSRPIARLIVGGYLFLASKLKRPNPHTTWQDAYAPHCSRCHYDLRASPNHCPECGERVPAYERTIIHYLIKIGDGPPRASS